MRRLTVIVLLTAFVGILNQGITAAGALTSAPAVKATSWDPNDPGTEGINAGPAVSCGTGVFCMAVGSEGPINASQTFATLWVGGAWVQSTTPNPSGATSAALQGVSCVGIGFCMAVGDAEISGTQVTLTEQWNGSEWSVAPSPNPSGSDIALSGVNCTSSSFCAAVGSTGSSGTPLIETWNGSSWSISSSVGPSGATSVQLLSVKCIGATWCMTVGRASSGGNGITVAEVWNGSTWSVLPTPNVGGGSSASELDGVSCAGQAFCQAVGHSVDASANLHNLIEGWNGSSWSIVVAPDSGSASINSLGGVSCISATVCTAVGSAGPSANSLSTIVLNWDGAAWTVDPSPPADEAAATGTALSSISCITNSVCVTIGSYVTSSNAVFAYGATADMTRTGYRLVASDGGVFNYGAGAPFLGSLGNLTLNRPIVGMAVAPGGDGYWLVASDGGVFAFGSAQFYGSMGGKPLNNPIVGMAATADGAGYWLVASDGGIFSFGDAQFYGSMGGAILNQPVVDMASSPDGLGYYMVASDGGIFSFGDTQFYGSTGSIHLNKPVVGMTVPGGGGYYLVGADGGVFNFPNSSLREPCPPTGAACNPLLGSAADLPLNRPIVGIATGVGGYYLVASDGGIFAYDLPFLGSIGGSRLNAPIVGMAT